MGSKGRELNGDTKPGALIQYVGNYYVGIWDRDGEHEIGLVASGSMLVFLGWQFEIDDSYTRFEAVAGNATGYVFLHPRYFRVIEV